MQRPVESEWKLVVVLGYAPPEEAKHMGVGEVEPEESLVAQSGENVPRRCNCEEEKRSADETKLAPATPLAGQKQIWNGGGNEEDRCYKPLRQHGERERCVGPVKAIRFVVFESRQKCIKRAGDEKRKDRFRNV